MADYTLPDSLNFNQKINPQWHQEHVPISRANYCFMILGILFCTIIVVSNTLGTKLIAAPYPVDLSLPVGMILYPVTFMISDILTELWGKNRARLIIYIGFLMTLVLLAMIRIGIDLPPGRDWFVANNPYGFTSPMDYQRALEATFSTTTFAIFGSLTAYTAAQLVDVFLFNRIKHATQGRYLWLRANLSIWISQLIDSFIIGFIVYRMGFHMDGALAFKIIGWTYLYKVMIVFALTPVLYLIIGGIKYFCANDPLLEHTHEKLNTEPQN